jgi:hypothetical protein
LPLSEKFKSKIPEKPLYGPARYIHDIREYEAVGKRRRDAPHQLEYTGEIADFVYYFICYDDRQREQKIRKQRFELV